MRIFSSVPAMALAVISITVLGTAPRASAAIVNYEFVPATNFTLDRAGTISGGFTYDTTTFAMTNINATVTGASGFDGTYTFTFAPWNNAQVISFMYAADSASANTFAMLALEFSGSLDGSPGLDPLVAMTGYNLPGNYRGSSFSGGLEVSSTPLPAALPLFATGLGVMGFLAKRRKRKAAANAA
jgi:hypothetical protein